jgi:PAS domain-containing protein
VDPTLLATTESELLKLRLELESLKLQQRQLLKTLSHGIILLDQQDVITAYNDAALQLWNITGEIAGERIQHTQLASSCPELIENLHALRSSSQESVSFQCILQHKGDDRTLAVLLQGARNVEDQLSIIIHCDDVSRQHELEGAVEQLEYASRQLQSTNEQLETTDRELQSLNRQLHLISSELDKRTRELERLKACFSAALDLIPCPVLVLDDHNLVQYCNRELGKIFALSDGSVSGVDIAKMQLPPRLISEITRGLREVLKSKGVIRVSVPKVDWGSRVYDFELRFNPVETGSGSNAVLVIIAAGAKKHGQKDTQHRIQRHAGPDGARPKTPEKRKI